MSQGALTREKRVVALQYKDTIVRCRGVEGVRHRADISLGAGDLFADGLYTKGTRAHTHRELIRAWLWEPKGSFLESGSVGYNLNRMISRRTLHITSLCVLCNSLRRPAAINEPL